VNKTAYDKTRELLIRCIRTDTVWLSENDAETLRRAELTLHRWAEDECGWSTGGMNGGSFALVRDEDGDNKPYIEFHPNVGMKTIWRKIPDREAGALRRVADVCRRNGLDYYHQGDPRGCALYISKAGAGMNDTNYNQFVACSVN